MVLTLSQMNPLGSEAPDFAMKEADGTERRLADFAESRALLVAFICNHCPFVIHIAPELVRLEADYSGRGVALLAINPNDAAISPADAPELMAEEKSRRGYRFPYLFDADQSCARAYGAVCTPDFFLYDRSRHLVYRGRLDGSTPGNGVATTGVDLRFALDAALAGETLDPAAQKPSQGCSIKWKAGMEPSWT